MSTHTYINYNCVLSNYSTVIFNFMSRDGTIREEILCKDFSHAKDDISEVCMLLVLIMYSNWL